MNIVYTLADLEAAINFWRARSPSRGEELVLCPQASALAEPYAMLIFNSQQNLRADQLTPDAQAALEQWQASRQTEPNRI